MALINDIRALPQEVLDTRDTAQIAAALPVIVSVRPHMISERGVLAALPVPAGDVFLSALEAFAAATLPDGHPLVAYHGTIKRGVGWLKGEGLDLGDPLTRTLLDTLAQVGVVDASSVAALKALAEVTERVSEADVIRACYGDGPDWMV